MNTAIKINHLSKDYQTATFKKVNALSNLCLDITEGECFGFIGPNGAGKSTTIKILTGVLTPTSGDAMIYGKSVQNPAARLGVGYVPENPYLSDYLTPYEVLTISLEMHKVKPASKRQHIMNWLERLEIAHVAKKTIRSFSKGMTQRTAIAQAMCIEPKMLILDEPLSGLDPIGRRDVVNLLAEYKKNQGTLFFTSHVLHDVEQLADRFGLIHQGKLSTVKSPTELWQGEQTFKVSSIGSAAPTNFARNGNSLWSAEVLESELWPTLQHLHELKHQIQEVKSLATLENVFLKITQTNTAK